MKAPCRCTHVSMHKMSQCTELAYRLEFLDRVQFLDWREYAVFVQQVHWGMRNILSLSAQSCSASGNSGPISLRAQKRCKHSCGRLIKLVLPNLSMRVCKR